MIDYFLMIAFSFVILLPVHEFGHYLAAKKDGIYKGWGFLPNPHIKLAEPYGSRWGYLSGLASSLFLYPVWAYIGLGSWILFVILCVSAASQDIAMLILYWKLLDRRKKRK